MKRIIYKLDSKTAYPEHLLEKSLECADSDFSYNLSIAQQEAYGGEYTVEDIPDAESAPTAQEDTDAMLIEHEYRLTLLELGLNESEV